MYSGREKENKGTVMLYIYMCVDIHLATKQNDGIKKEGRVKEDNVGKQQR